MKNTIWIWLFFLLILLLLLLLSLVLWAFRYNRRGPVWVPIPEPCDEDESIQQTNLQDSSITNQAVSVVVDAVDAVDTGDNGDNNAHHAVTITEEEDAGSSRYCGSKGQLCGAQETCCNGECIDVMGSNAHHCGQCHHACGVNDLCDQGMCKAKCRGGYTPVPDGRHGYQCVISSECASDPTTCGPIYVCMNSGDQGYSCVCPPGTMACDNTCIDVTDDSQNCGSCHSSCQLPHATSQCIHSQCEIISCEQGWANCDETHETGCETNLSSPEHCGTCGQSCQLPHATAVCQDARCFVDQCETGWGNCDGQASTGCETLIHGNDVHNCGECGHECASNGGYCQLGTCQCPTGTVFNPLLNRCDTSLPGTLSSAAVDAATVGLSSFADCGSDPSLCTGGTVCVNQLGILACLCPVGQTLCNGTCIPLVPNDSQCGQCNQNPCVLLNALALCNGGQCQVSSCLPGFANCDGDSLNGCETSLLTDPQNCGACGTACSFAHGIGACVAGVCTLIVCEHGWQNCDGTTTHGCEVHLVDDTHNCGACGHVCPTVAHATVHCAHSQCEIRECDAGWEDCDGLIGNGCESFVATDRDNCGACGTVCPTGAFCSAGQCYCPSCTQSEQGACVPVQCPNGFTCMNGVCTGDNECANGNPCPAPRLCQNIVSGQNGQNGQNGSTVSSAGAGSGVGSGQNPVGGSFMCVCPPGMIDCNGTCADLKTDEFHCGTCQHSCDLPNIETTHCENSQCVIDTCVPGFGNCIPNESGCETNLMTNLNHCGECGNDCANGTFANGSTTCVAGQCILTCNLGFGNCNNTPENGCETHIMTDKHHCGTCGHVCSAGQVCHDGQCECSQGLSMCEGLCMDLSTDVTTCGSCSHSCASDQICIGGECVCPTGQHEAAMGGICVPICPSGQTLVSGTGCVSLAGCSAETDPSCPDTFVCQEDMCVCPEGTIHCGDKCLDLDHNCGICGKDCTALFQVAQAHCESGSSKCVIDQCRPGFADCDDQTSNGCETQLCTIDHCGSCNETCTTSLPHVQASCTSQEGKGCGCSYSCQPGWAVCGDADPLQVGCTVSILTDSQNCGHCGNVCVDPDNYTTSRCTQGECVITCQPGFTNCQGVCRLTDSDVNNCGNCDRVCPPIPNADATCQHGQCDMVCRDGFANCDGMYPHGCETELSTSNSHCGSCGNSCTTDSTCMDGKCLDDSS